MLRQGIPHTVITSESEAQDYLDTYDGVSVRAVRSEGIGLVRQEILRMARLRGQRTIWMIDDDITTLSDRDDSNLTRSGKPQYLPFPWRTALLHMQKIMDQYPDVGAVSPMVRHFAWTFDEPRWNRRMGYVVRLRTDGPWDYWPHFHEDTDLTLQILTAGWQTIHLNQYAYQTPAMGTLEGGCHAGYLSGEDERSGRLLVEKWEQTHPGLVRLGTSASGSVTTRIDWKRFGNGSKS